MTAITIYSRPGCHLCEQMKDVVDRVVRQMNEAAPSGPIIAVEEVDISTDPALEERYRVEIPVLMLNGRKAAKYRVREEELLRTLTNLQPGHKN